MSRSAKREREDDVNPAICMKPADDSNPAAGRPLVLEPPLLSDVADLGALGEIALHEPASFDEAQLRVLSTAGLRSLLSRSHVLARMRSGNDVAVDYDSDGEEGGGSECASETASVMSSASQRDSAEARFAAAQKEAAVKLAMATAEAEALMRLLHMLRVRKQLVPAQLMARIPAEARAIEAPAVQHHLKATQLRAASEKLRAGARTLRAAHERDELVRAQLKRLRAHWQLTAVTMRQVSIGGVSHRLPNVRVRLPPSASTSSASLRFASADPSSVELELHSDMDGWLSVPHVATERVRVLGGGDALAASNHSAVVDEFAPRDDEGDCGGGSGDGSERSVHAASDAVHDALLSAHRSHRAHSLFAHLTAEARAQNDDALLLLESRRMLLTCAPTRRRCIEIKLEGEAEGAGEAAADGGGYPSIGAEALGDDDAALISPFSAIDAGLHARWLALCAACGDPACSVQPTLLSWAVEAAAHDALRQSLCRRLDSVAARWSDPRASVHVSQPALNERGSASSIIEITISLSRDSTIDPPARVAGPQEASVSLLLHGGRLTARALGGGRAAGGAEARSVHGLLAGGGRGAPALSVASAPAMVHMAVGRVLLLRIAARAEALGLSADLWLELGYLALGRTQQSLASLAEPWLRVRVIALVHDDSQHGEGGERQQLGGRAQQPHLHVTSSLHEGEIEVHALRGQGELDQLTRLFVGTLIAPR
mmetsp:Transcript_32661/g.76164  ORF Transcript_32661/g.76164 Transcript_32661/m.76164 type:complete len:715 (-) Transcript_32661:406-2550(-)